MDWFESATELLKANANLFTPGARQALRHACEAAEHFNHDYVGTEHILLGLVKLEQGFAVTALKQFGLNFENVLVEVKKRVPMELHRKISGSLPYTPRARRVMEVAKKDLKRLDHSHLGTEHILLGLLSEQGGVAAEVFKSFNINMERLRGEILKEHHSNPRDEGDRPS